MRAVIADDSSLFRKVLSQALSSLPNVEIVGMAPNGKLALQKVLDLKPDLLTLDMEMPEMGGLEVLDALRQSGSPTTVIVVSALTRKGGALTLRALEKGAFDFITKPDTSNSEESLKLLSQDLAPRIRVIANRLEIRKILAGTGKSAASPAQKDTVPTPSTPSPNLDDIPERMKRLSTALKPEMVLIGVSTGGPNALALLIPQLPGDLGVPIFIVQHMPPIFTETLAESLNAKSAIRVYEGRHGQKAEPNTAYLAPGGRQMRLSPGPKGAKIIEVTDDPPENNCRPSVDYLFRSAAHHFPGRAVAVILTGMGSDGTLGLRLLKRHGCLVIAQDEASCVVYGMPKAAVEAGVVDAVLPLSAISARIVSAVGGPRA